MTKVIDLTKSFIEAMLFGVPLIGGVILILTMLGVIII